MKVLLPLLALVALVSSLPLEEADDKKILTKDPILDDKTKAPIVKRCAHDHDHDEGHNHHDHHASITHIGHHLVLRSADLNTKATVPKELDIKEMTKDNKPKDKVKRSAYGGSMRSLGDDGGYGGGASFDDVRSFHDDSGRYRREAVEIKEKEALKKTDEIIKPKVKRSYGGGAMRSFDDGGYGGSSFDEVRSFGHDDSRYRREAVDVKEKEALKKTDEIIKPKMKRSAYGGMRSFGDDGGYGGGASFDEGRSVHDDGGRYRRSAYGGGAIRSFGDDGGYGGSSFDDSGRYRREAVEVKEKEAMKKTEEVIKPKVKRSAYGGMRSFDSFGDDGGYGGSSFDEVRSDSRYRRDTTKPLKVSSEVKIETPAVAEKPKEKAVVKRSAYGHGGTRDALLLSDDSTYTSSLFDDDILLEDFAVPTRSFAVRNPGFIRSSGGYGRSMSLFDDAGYGGDGGLSDEVAVPVRTFSSAVRTSPLGFIGRGSGGYGRSLFNDDLLVSDDGGYGSSVGDFSFASRHSAPSRVSDVSLGRYRREAPETKPGTTTTTTTTSTLSRPSAMKPVDKLMDNKPATAQ